MWIPGPLYESLPYLYILGGVLFISGTLYIGVTAPGASLYIACGLISIVYGVVVFVRRPGVPGIIGADRYSGNRLTIQLIYEKNGP